MDLIPESDPQFITDLIASPPQVVMNNSPTTVTTRSVTDTTTTAAMGCMASSGSASDIKSTAVVKYSSMKIPVNFSTIRLNTNLNFPPSDRARAGYFSYSNQSVHNNTSQFSTFSSLNMANTYQDLVGKVDVISSSKNIKALLKMPYSQAPQTSLMVHRLGKTLLLEEFDVHKNLLRQEVEEWKWLKSFFRNTVAKTGNDCMKKMLVSAGGNRDSLSDNMYLNLIRHSIAASVDVSQCSALESSEQMGQVNSMPVPSEEDLKGFHNEFLWKFEDISMLIDSDLPIFGNGNSSRPCISLRLRDARSPPINVLTGLDYWLDNLMSNVPEVAMCYHINGLIQKYEVIRTEDIPRLDNSNFNPTEVMDIARNIMSFIKSNAAVEGHTYWLYKNENDEMVKLYDLTEHCKNEIKEGDNPFTVPVGLLCYRVGRNLKISGQRRSADSRAMLENCIRLLDDSKHSQACVDAHFHLSDMWVPDRSVNDIWHGNGKISDGPSDLYEDVGSSECSTSRSESEDEEDEIDVNGAENCRKMRVFEDNESPRKKSPLEKEKNSVALRELVVRGMVRRKAWDVVRVCSIAGETDERCSEALNHIRKGLTCLDRDQAKGKNIGLVEKQQTCSPSRAIPLPYKPLNISTKDSPQANIKYSDNSKGKEDTLPTCNPFKPIPLHYLSGKSKADDQGDRNGDGDEPIMPGLSEVSSHSTSLSSESRSGESSSEGTSQGTTKEDSACESWHVQAKYRLLRKAAISYFVLANQFYEIRKHGHTLRHIRYALHCYECLALLTKSGEQEDPQLEEVFMLLLYLAAKTRTCLPTIWQTCHRDFQELGEEEAAILHSAQAVLSVPKYAWIYEWPSTQEANLLTANEIYLKLSEMPVNKVKPQGRIELKRNHASCLMNLGNTQTEIVKDRILKNLETFEGVEAMWNKSKQSFQEAMRLFESVNDKNMAGHVCSNMAYVYMVAAMAYSSHNEDLTIPMLPQEKELLFKAIEWKEKGLNKLERGEHMDPVRETFFNDMRCQYQQMATRFLMVPHILLTKEHVSFMKDMMIKSLSYCHLEPGSRYLRASQTCAAGNYLNLARVHEVEASTCKIPSRKKTLLQKAEESYQLCYDIFSELKWCRSQIFAKQSWIQGLLENVESTVSANQLKKIQRCILAHLSDLHAPVKTMLAGEASESDCTPVHVNNLSAVKQLIRSLNSSFCTYLKIEKNNTKIKNLYQRSLRLTPLDDTEEILKPLLDILLDLKSFLGLDSSSH